jgi:hypothetical protein
VKNGGRGVKNRRRREKLLGFLLGTEGKMKELKYCGQIGGNE